jgi:hypothetical protein
MPRSYFWTILFQQRGNGEIDPATVPSSFRDEKGSHTNSIKAFQLSLRATKGSMPAHRSSVLAQLPCAGERFGKQAWQSKFEIMRLLRRFAPRNGTPFHRFC